MDKFPHLKFSENLIGKARFTGGGKSHPDSVINKNNRQQYSQSLLGKTNQLKSDWLSHISERNTQHLAPLDENIEPIFLKINPSLLEDLGFDLENFHIEIISQEDDGYIVGASLDNLKTLEEKIRLFAENKRGGGRIADFWEIIEGNRETWKPNHILSAELFEKWNTISETQIYQVEVAIAFAKPIAKEPDATKKKGLELRQKKYREKLEKRDELLMARQIHFEKFVDFYNGTFESGLVDLGDSFACEISITGKCLKDLVVNYPFVFEVSEKEEVSGEVGDNANELSFQLEILAPPTTAPEIGIIDSGIMENHVFLQQAIIPANSKSYLITDNTVADQVTGGGHGTKVAGAVLYPNGVSSLTKSYQLPCFVRNLRVLNNNNQLEHQFPAELMQKIVEENPECPIFNLSINSRVPYKLKHMSSWASMIDKLIHEKEVLFFSSAGNLDRDTVREYIQRGDSYPNYLSEANCRLANPAQSSFSMVVGSVNHLSLNDNDWESIGNENDVAAYSRIGTGIWGHIKPDIVEYGGGFQISKNGKNQISNKDTATELVRSTLNGGGAYAKESVGTSFATPKAVHIAAELYKLYYSENNVNNLIRALIVQGARLPNPLFQTPTKIGIRQLGYGLPSLDRVTRNSEHRITFYNTKTISAEQGQIYSLKIPQNLRKPEDDYDILIEVTLAYTAKNRRTRQKTKSYLGTWLEWQSSKLSDSYDIFKANTLSELEGAKIEKAAEKNKDVIPWKIRERGVWGVEDISRNSSTLQKDWAVLKSYALPEEVHFAVLAHKGWDANKEPIPYALTVSIEILGKNIPIYNEIRLENGIEIPIEV
jgi:hypothetical protein